MPPSPDEKTPVPGNNQNPIDLDSILLPKKDSGPNIESAQRVNAGALLAQEDSASLPKTEPKTPVRLMVPPPAPSATPAQTAPFAPPPPPAAPAPSATAPFAPKAAPAPAPAAAPAATSVPFTPATMTPAPAAAPVAEAPSPDAIRPLQTYKGDLERVVTDKGVSVVSVAAAEAERRGKQPLQPESAEEKDARGKTYVMVAIGLLLILIAGAVVAIVVTRQTTVDVDPPPTAPFITIDGTRTVPVPANQNDRDSVMTNLVAARQQSGLALGLIEWLSLAEPSLEHKVPPRRLGMKEILGIIAPQAPQELLRVVDDIHFIGVHSFDENQPFLLMRVDSYEVAYKAMLDWEATMRTDLSPFFARNPSPYISGEAPLDSGGTLQFLQTGFVDRVVENRDARVIQNDNGDILLLWAFLGRNIILVTTNEFTLREVLSRLSAAPVVPIPGK